MADGYLRKFPADQGDKKKERITTGCQYCAVGCGYNAFLVPEGLTEGEEIYGGVSRFITPSMTNTINFRGQPYKIAVAPDARCDLNKGNHSVRGGSQGENLVTHDGCGRSTKDRLKSPQVRLADGRLHDISWTRLNEVMARLLVRATRMQADRSGQRIQVKRREALGVKIYEYQYLENTYAATKLFYSAIGTPNVAYHDRPSAAGSSPGLEDVGFRPHDFSYDDVRHADVLFFIGTNPYENQSVFFMQYCQGKQIIVIDPRKTATAQYAEQTGGLHLQSTKLGADSLVLYALAGEIIRRWTEVKDHRFEDFPLRADTGTNINDLPVTDARPKKQAEKRRRASRAMSFEAFAREFLRFDDPSSTYSLENASEKSGIPVLQLQEAVGRLFDPAKTTLTEQPRVAILYEKGMIWGFNYHNTAAVGSLGLLLGAYCEPGRLVGRVGGHQKGWAEARTAVPVFEKSTGEGYPFRNARDQYADEWLVQLRNRRPDEIKDEAIGVYHNLDNHVFGVDKSLIDRSLGSGKVRLSNGLITKRNPDVRLLWIIGGNYLGQTNDSQRKLQELSTRLRKGGAGGCILRPAARQSYEELTADEIVDALGSRIDARGIVLVHQEIFANPTTDLCDIVIPAAGWGEDTFCRYNAQRRLKLYDRFQDMPLHADDQKMIKANADQKDRTGNDPHRLDPMRYIDDFQHSPKPDWRIIRDIAHEVGCVLDGGNKGNLYADIAAAFPWEDSFELADEMAAGSNRKSMLGDLLPFGKAQGITADKGIVHSVLGKQGDGESAHLKEPKYLIPGQSRVYGNGIASNGVMLPVRGVTNAKGEVVRLEGTLSVQRAGPFFFIAAPWQEIEPFYNAVLPVGNELFITNGRFNHLWNNMFHHLRNDYVNQRFPENLPGTILELNPVWAGRQDPRILNGDLVNIEFTQTVKDKKHTRSFRAIASLQHSVPQQGAFAMFSYPVRHGNGGFLFDGYVNNITNGYADGINPIAALKYGKAVVTRVGPSPVDVGTHAARNVISTAHPKPLFAIPDSEGIRTGLDKGENVPNALRQAFRDNGIALPESVHVRVDVAGRQWRLTAASENTTTSFIVRLIQAELEILPGRWETAERIDWEMREVIVRKGLPRAYVDDDHILDGDAIMLKPDELMEHLRDDDLEPSAARVRLLTQPRPSRPSRMHWRSGKAVWDEWPLFEHHIVEKFVQLRTSAGGNGMGNGNGIDPAQAKRDMLALIRKKRDDDNAASRHDSIDIGAGKSLDQLFADEGELLTHLAMADVVDNKIPGLGSNKLVVANDLAKSVFYQLIVRDDGIMNGRFEDDEVKTIERWIQSGAAHDD